MMKSKLELIYFILFNFIFIYKVFCDSQKECEFYLAPSLLNGAGRGVFIGKTSPINRVLEVSPTLIVHKNFCKNWSLDNYIYAFDDNYSLVIFGMAMLYNHNIPSLISAGHSWDESPVDCKSNSYEPNSVCTNVNYFTKKEIYAGEEIFTTYGGTDWFTLRNIPIDIPNELDSNAKAPSYRLDELTKVGFCLSDTFVAPSTIPMAGRGLFANRDFKKGDIVTISPVLFLPKHEVIQASVDSTILNYCIASMAYGDVAIFPIGTASMINHQMSSIANVVMEWHGFTEITNVTLSKDPRELESSQFSPIDIAFIATKDIRANEEITMNYGEEWINAWSNYLIKLISVYINKESSIPKFRHAIQPPPGFFPDNWHNINCIGKFCLHPK